MKNNCDIKYSVIVLLEEESDGFASFIENLYETFASRKEGFEILIIANGTEGFLKDQSVHFRQYNDQLKMFILNRKTSQAVCLRAALNECFGSIIVVCGSYKQIEKKSFINLINALDENSDIHIISPWRQDRVDPPFNQFQSRIFNNMVRKAVGTKLHDLSCTVKIVRREVLEETELYGNMYRFLPIIAERKGFKTKEVECKHHQEQGKTGFYNFFEYIERITDILTLYFNTGFTRKPLRFFGSIGMLFFAVGLIILSLIFFQRMFFQYPIGDRPATLLTSIMFIVLGVQAAGVGLLGEIIVFIQGRNIKEYSVSHYASHVYTGLERRNKGRYHGDSYLNYDGDKKRLSDQRKTRRKYLERIPHERII